MGLVDNAGAADVGLSAWLEDVLMVIVTWLTMVVGDGWMVTVTSIGSLAVLDVELIDVEAVVADEMLEELAAAPPRILAARVGS